VCDLLEKAAREVVDAENGKWIVGRLTRAIVGLAKALQAERRVKP